MTCAYRYCEAEATTRVGVPSQKAVDLLVNRQRKAFGLDVDVEGTIVTVDVVLANVCDSHAVLYPEHLRR